MDAAPILFLVLIAAAFWLLVIRPARTRQQQQAKVVAALGPGSRVLLASGMIGEVEAVRPDEIDVRIAPGVVATFVPQAVLREAPLPEPPDHDAPGHDTAGDGHDDSSPPDRST